MSETARETIARLGSEVNGLKERLGMLTALHRGCAGIRAENTRLRGDLDTALGLRRMESRRVDAVRAQAEALAAALEEVFRETEHINTRRGSRNGRIREVAEAALRAYREGRDE